MCSVGELISICTNMVFQVRTFTTKYDQLLTEMTEEAEELEQLISIIEKGNDKLNYFADEAWTIVSDEINNVFKLYTKGTWEVN